MTGIGLDFDRDGDPQRVAAALSSFAGLVHTTKKHTDAAPRCRAIVWPSRPVTPSEQTDLWAYVVSTLPPDLAAGLDRGTRDESRLWFLPSRDANGAPGTVIDLAGEPLDVDDVLERIAIQEEPANLSLPAASDAPRRTSQASSVLARATAYVDACSPAVSGSGGHETTWSVLRGLAGWLTKGLSSADASMLVSRWNGRCVPPWAPHEIDRHWERAQHADKIPDHEDRRVASASRNGRPAIPATNAPSDRPTIALGTDLHRVVDDACAALVGSSLYQRDGELVRIVRADEPNPRKGVVPGTPMIRPVPLPTLREELCRCASWERWDPKTKELRACTPPDGVTSAVLARASWPGLRPLAGITETPVLRLDGSILSTQGYDPRTGLEYVPTCDVPSVPVAPTRADASQALAELCEVFADFPFVDDAARYVPVAAVLTMLARPAIDGPTPMIANDAPTRGTGKSLLLDVVAMIATGRSAPRMTYPPDEVELEKVLASCALFGARIVALDNIVGTLGAAPLDKALTCDDRLAVRVLGKSEVRELAWRALVIATGNNLVLGADTARRTLVCRMEPDVERPEERTGFQHPDLLGYVREHRGRLVAAALTVLRAFVVAGRPDASRHTWGSFQSWAELVPASIAWAGGANVLDCRAVSMGAPDLEADALRTILAMLPTLAPDGATARTIVTTLWPAGERGERRPPDGYDGLREALEALSPPRREGDAPSPRELGKALRRGVGRIVGGRRLRSRPGKGAIITWSVEVVS